MLVSHKHKLIFIKTHKTSTQTFNNFMKDKLGPSDVVTGDPKHGTQINISSVFGDSGLCALDFQSKYGNHLPWFIVKEIVGDRIWNDYHKITIERDPRDRLVSLFCFLNPLLTTLGCKRNPDLKYSKEERLKLSSSTVLKEFPQEVRDYFYDWVEIQLEAEILPVDDELTYSAEAISIELENYRAAGERLGINPWFYDQPSKIMHNMGKQNLCDFPPLKTDRVLIPDMQHRNPDHVNFKRYIPFEGQCRFLNYGYYHDGEKLQIDHVIDYKNVAENIGSYFQDNNIDIVCDNNCYNSRSKNVHFRKDHDIPEVDWWYDTPRGKSIESKLYIVMMYNNYI